MVDVCVGDVGVGAVKEEGQQEADGEPEDWEGCWAESLGLYVCFSECDLVFTNEFNKQRALHIRCISINKTPNESTIRSKSMNGCLPLRSSQAYS